MASVQQKILVVLMVALATLCFLVPMFVYVTWHMQRNPRAASHLSSARMMDDMLRSATQPRRTVSFQQSPGVYTLPLDARTYAAGRSSFLARRSTDARDRVLSKHTFAKCREGNSGSLVGGLDTRPEPAGPGEPKYVCGVRRLGSRRPCVVYSFGSHDEIMFEIGIKGLAPQCEVHTFDHIKLPEQESVRQFNFSVHRWALGTGSPADTANVRAIDVIMQALNHSHVDILKVDIEVSAEVLLVVRCRSLTSVCRVPKFLFSIGCSSVHHS
jgi:hypothetical protein